MKNKKETLGDVMEKEEIISFCNHQFFKINDETKFKVENMQSIPVRWGVKVMCVLCGQQRILWSEGEVETL